MRKAISSAATPFYKFAFPTIWIGAFGVGTLVMAVQGSPETLIFLVLWLVGSSFLGLLALRLKRVELEDGNLIISNYRRSVVVSVAAVKYIEERRLTEGRAPRMSPPADRVFKRMRARGSGACRPYNGRAPRRHP